MKYALIVLALIFAPNLAWAQCIGAFQASSVCGPTAGGLPKQIMFTLFPAKVDSVFGRTAPMAAQTGDYSSARISELNSISGAIKGNGAGNLPQAACGDLSNAAVFCSTDTTNAGNISNGALALARGGLGGSLASATANQIPIYPGSGGAAVPTSAPTWFDAAYCSTVGYVIAWLTGQWTCSNAIPINAVWLGADNACGSDASTSINNALSQASSGGRVYLPRGTYCLTSHIILNTRQFIYGDGPDVTILKSKTGTACTPLISSYNFASLTGTNTASGPYKFGIANLSVDGNKANVTGVCDNIRIYGYNYDIDNVESYNSTGRGLFSEWATSATVPVAAGGDGMEAFVTKFRAFSNVGVGIQWDGPHDSTLTDVLSFINSGVGLGIASSATVNGNVVLKNVHIYGNSNTGLYISGSRGATAVVFAAQLESESNTGGSSHGIDVEANGQLIANGVWVYNNGGRGINMPGSNSVLTGVVATGNGTYGVRVSGNNNVLTSVLSASNGTYGVGIYGSNNILVGARAFSNPTANYDIGAANNASGNY